MVCIGTGGKRLFPGIHPTPIMNKSEQRRRVRDLRRSLDHETRLRYSAQSCELLRNSPYYRRARRIAGYVAFDGEMSPDPLLQQAVSDGKELYLPVVGTARHPALRFARVDADTEFRQNRYGIMEPNPATAECVEARWLDTVIVPLVAFDNDGNRLGMGSGYYDRTFHFLLRRRHWRKPKLVGLAYDAQRVATLEPSDWDVPLNAVATETSLIRFANI